MVASPSRHDALVPSVTTLDVQGMRCAGCVKAVERQLTQQAGVSTAVVNLVTEVAVITYEPSEIEPEVIASSLSEAGFPSEPRHTEAESFTQYQNKRVASQREQYWRLGAAVILLAASSLGHLHHLTGLPVPFLHLMAVHWAIATLALLIPGMPILRDGWQSLWQGHANMNTLVGLGTLSAYLTSCLAWLRPQLGWDCFFDEPVMLLGFILLGRTLEGGARLKAIAALEALLALQPQEARLVGREQRGETEAVTIPVSQVQIGEWLRVLPGEKVPVDGEVIRGETTVDESMLTGESLPQPKIAKDLVKAGTINQLGVIVIQVTQTAQHTLLAQIVRTVEAAQTRKAPVQKMADTVAGYFAYGVLAIAFGVFCFWRWLGIPLWLAAQNINPDLLSLKLAIAVLVIACPCALGLATPTALLVGTSLGAKAGLLIKGGDILERLSKITTVIFDKTGTLTRGKAEIVALQPYGDWSTGKVLQLAASLEQQSNHPFGQAFLALAAKQELTLNGPIAVDTILGKGITGEVAGRQVTVGSPTWLSAEGLTWPETVQQQLESWAELGYTSLIICVDHNLAGLVAIADPIRDDAANLISTLQEKGLEILLLSGDQNYVVQNLAQQLQINQAQGGLSPQDKAAVIAALQAEGEVVAMVGDGINDALALATADLGVSLQGGTDVALATADIVLMGDRLGDITPMLALSKATNRIIRQNLLWACGYNLVAIPLAAGALLPTFGITLSPAIAAAMMAMSSVLVVGNSLRLKRMNIFQ